MRPKFKIIEIWCIIGKGRHLHMYMQSGTWRSVDGRLGRLSASAEMDRYRQMSDPMASRGIIGFVAGPFRGC